MTGEVINSTPAREESIAVIGIDNDGSVVIGNSPLRRGAVVGVTEILGNGLLGEALADLLPPLTGGVTKYAPSSRFDLAARDAVCYAARKVLAWEVGRDSAGYTWLDSPEASSYQALTGQAVEMLGLARAVGEISSDTYAGVSYLISDARESALTGDFRAAHSVLREACQQLD
jgi:hypothetical protein